MLIELTSIPSTQTDRIAAFVAGANAVIQKGPSDCASPTPVAIEVEYRSSGNAHIWLMTGSWQDGGTVHWPVLPWA